MTTTTTLARLDLVGTATIAERLGVKQITVYDWMAKAKTDADREVAANRTARIPMPAPDGYVDEKPVWLWKTIERWAADTGRLT